jgi:hypothetical protein
MIKLSLIYAVLIACGFGFRYYRWWDDGHPDATWQAHLLQWWWSYGGMAAIYMMRFIRIDTMFAAIGQGVAVVGAACVGYVIGHAFINDIKEKIHGLG